MFVPSDLDALDTAIKSGTLRVQFADRSVTYRSISEMLQVRALIVTELAASVGPPIRRQYRIYTDKGWST